MEYLDVKEKKYEIDAFENGLMFSFKFATTEILVKEEEFIYPPLSFIAEVVGALCLYLGLSFVTVWNFVKWILVRYTFVPTE